MSDDGRIPFEAQITTADAEFTLGVYAADVDAASRIARDEATALGHEVVAVSIVTEDEQNVEHAQELAAAEAAARAAREAEINAVVDERLKAQVEAAVAAALADREQNAGGTG